MASRLNQVLYGRSCAYKMQNTEMKLSRLAERSGEEFVFSLHLLKMFNGLTCLQYPIIAIVLLVDAPKQNNDYLNSFVVVIARIVAFLLFTAMHLQQTTSMRCYG